MTMCRGIAALGAALAFGAVASPAYAATVTVDGTMTAARFTFVQTTGDCEEAAVDAVFGAVTGARMREATIIKEAQKLGVLSANPADGSNWFGPSGIVKLMAHYGIASTIGSHTIQTIEADLKAGRHVIANVNAETLWNSAFPGQYVVDDRATPDHAVVLDEVDVTRGTATVTDSAVGLSYVVPLGVFRAAVATSGFEYDVTGGK